MCSSADCSGHPPGRGVRIRAILLLVLSVASVGLIIAKGPRTKTRDGSGATTADAVFCRDTAAQRRDAARLLTRLPRTTGSQRVAALLAAESGTSALSARGTARAPAAGLSSAMLRHFQSDVVLARIEVASGADQRDLAHADQLLAHGRRGIASLRAA